MSIADNIKRIREKYNLTQSELGRIAGVSDKAISTWENGTAKPRMGPVQLIADHLGIQKSSIIDDEQSDEETELLEYLHQCPEYKMLFSAAKGASKEDIELAAETLNRMKKDSGY